MSSNYDPTKGGTRIPAKSSVGVLFTWIGTRGDYASIEKRDKAVKGWRRKINPITMEGRFTFVIATWLTVAGIGLYVWRRKSASKQLQVQDKG